MALRSTTEISALTSATVCSSQRWLKTQLVRASGTFTVLTPESELPGECDRLATLLAASFSSEPQPVRQKYLFLRGFGIEELVRQWEIGGTNVSLRCSNTGAVKEDFNFVSIAYEPASSETKLVLPIHLLCSRTYALASDLERRADNCPSIDNFGAACLSCGNRRRLLQDWRARWHCPRQRLPSRWHQEVPKVDT